MREISPLIGRGIILGLTGGRSILYSGKAAEFPTCFHLGETNALGFNNQIPIALIVIILGAYALAKTRWSRDLRHRRQRAGVGLRGYRDRLGQDPCVPDLVVVRYGRPGQGRHRVMVLKRGENVGDRYVAHTSEQKVLEIIVSGTRETAATADQALGREA
jgi:hypothetical protein